MIVAVVNESSIVDEFTLHIEGVDPIWFTVQVGSASLFPNTEGRLEFDVHLPGDLAISAGQHDLVLRVSSRATTGEASRILPLAIKEAGTVKLSVSPLRIVTSSSGTYRLELRSTTNVDKLVELVFNDPNQELEAHLTPEVLSIPAGTVKEVVLWVQPTRRPRFGSQHTYMFTTLAQTKAAADQFVEPLGEVEGTLVYRSWLARLSGVPLWLRGLAITLFALAAAAAVMVWFLAQPGRRGPLIERAPALTNAVAAFEDVLNLPPETEPSANGGGGSPSVIPGPVPRINSFELQPLGDEGPATYVLAWQVEGAQTVTIRGTPQPEIQAGTLPLETLQDGEYVLEASNAAGTVQQSVGIVVLRPPEIEEFAVSPDVVSPGQIVTLTWRLKHAERASLNGDKVDPAGGTRVVTVATNTSFTLVADNRFGPDQKTIQVRVAAGTPTALPVGSRPAAKLQTTPGPTAIGGATPAITSRP